MSISRRKFITTGSVVTAAMMGSLSKAYSFSASDTVRIAIVGLNMGQHHLKGFAQLANVKIVALCDVDRQVLASVAKNNESLIGKVDLEVDYRKLLERKDIDAVILVTPNHWHALQTIWACQAGKDVYVEKPSSHTIWEGRKMIEAARKYNRIVQVGLQASSNTAVPEIAEWIGEGHIGKIQAIHAVWYKPRQPIGKKLKPLTVPSHIDYDLWLGPAKDEPLYRNKLHYDWHWDWNTGNGEMGNIGTHVVDVARYYLGDPGEPKSITAFGNRFHWDDAGSTPNMHVAAFNYEEAPIILELNNFLLAPGNRRNPAFHKISRGQVILCEGGEIRGHAGGKAYDEKGKVIKKFQGHETHKADFIQAVITRKKELLKCELERGHASCTLPLLGGIAWRTGIKASARDIEKHVGKNPWLLDAFERYQKQAKDWNFDLKKEPWICSPDLAFDSKVEKFTGHLANDANQYLKRQEYRKPYVVPERV